MAFGVQLQAGHPERSTGMGLDGRRHSALASNPNPDNISSIVLKIVDAIVSDGQLDECDISLREITTIRETMIHSLTAIYHARVDYPGFNPPRIPGPLPPLPRADLDSEERGVYSKASEVPISKGGEVEDEAVTQRVAKR